MTGLNSNINEVIEKFKTAGARSQAVDPSDALIVGINAARGKMSFRIFNKGQDANGGTFGKYTGKKMSLSQALQSRLFTRTGSKERMAGEQDQFSEYEIKRVSKGRQIRFKDLEFTGTLRRGIVVVKETPTRVVCVIVNAALAKISRHQEEQIGRILGRGPVKIFALSKEEIEIMRDNTLEALKQLYVRVFTT